MVFHDEEARVVVDDGCIVELEVHEIVKNGYIAFLEGFDCVVEPMTQAMPTDPVYRVRFPQNTLYELDPEYEGTRYEIYLAYGAYVLWVREADKNTLIIPRQP